MALIRPGEGFGEMIGLLDLLDGVIGLSNEIEFVSRLEMLAKLGSGTGYSNELIRISDQWERTLTIFILKCQPFVNFTCRTKPTKC